MALCEPKPLKQCKAYPGSVLAPRGLISVDADCSRILSTLLSHVMPKGSVSMAAHSLGCTIGQQQREAMLRLSLLDAGLLAELARAVAAKDGVAAAVLRPCGAAPATLALIEPLLLRPLREAQHATSPPSFVTLEAAATLLLLLEPAQRQDILKRVVESVSWQSPRSPASMPEVPALRVLVTGATGFLGGTVVKMLSSQGVQVTATGRDASKAAALLNCGKFLANPAL